MVKKFFVATLIAVSSLGVVSVSEAHHGDYDCRDGYGHRENYCCGGNYYGRGNSQNNYGDCCYDGAYCCR